MTIGAHSVTNGVAYVDPVVTANAENPEVVVTVQGALDPNPTPLVLSRADLEATGVDPGPLEDIGLVDGPSPEPSPSPAPASGAIAFVAPVPAASCKLRGTVRTELRILDDAGMPIPDADAKVLVKACRVTVGLDAATKCVRYDKRKEVFRASIKVPKGTSLGAHAIVARDFDAAGAVEHEATTAVSVVPRGRPRLISHDLLRPGLP
jgi:hypothetical protein